MLQKYGLQNKSSENYSSLCLPDSLRNSCKTWFLYLTGLETSLLSHTMLNFDHVVFTREISSVQLCPPIQRAWMLKKLKCQ